MRPGPRLPALERGSRRGRGAASPVTVRASVTITLTASQARLLGFLADLCEPPRAVRHSSYAALQAQGLIYLQGDLAKYRVTALGQRTIQELAG
ncbi:hypothetical protein [Kineosporia sp. NBRC 101731]|uniref:hypothetical protein n=1 Tax=Kineosporia sp. NBRC 101731 TaxID=3032199 RepID=UPI0025554E48|nr:hypothetical protein [Kineosporia sp. NBRC 101731]